MQKIKVRKKDGLIVAAILLVFVGLVAFQNCAPQQPLRGNVSNGSTDPTPGTCDFCSSPPPCAQTGTCATITFGGVTQELSSCLSGTSPCRMFVSFSAPSSLMPFTSCLWDIKTAAGVPVFTGVPGVMDSSNPNATMCTYNGSAPTLTAADPNSLNFLAYATVRGQQGSIATTSNPGFMVVVKNTASPTPTPTPSGTPSSPTPTPTPVGTPANALAWFNLSWDDSICTTSCPPSLKTSCPTGWIAQASFHGSDLLDSDLDSTLYNGANNGGWISVCEPSANKTIKFMGSTSGYPSCAGGYTRQGRFKIYGNGYPIYNDDSGANYSYTTYVSICAQDSTAIKLVSNATNPEVQCPTSPTKYYLGGSFGFKSTGIIEAYDYSNAYFYSGRIGFCMKDSNPTLIAPVNPTINPAPMHKYQSSQLSWTNQNSGSVYTKYFMVSSTRTNPLALNFGAATTGTLGPFYYTTTTYYYFLMATCSNSGVVGCKTTPLYNFLYYNY